MTPDVKKQLYSHRHKAPKLLGAFLQRPQCHHRQQKGPEMISSPCLCLVYVRPKGAHIRPCCAKHSGRWWKKADSDKPKPCFGGWGASQGQTAPRAPPIFKPRWGHIKGVSEINLFTKKLLIFDFIPQINSVICNRPNNTEMYNYEAKTLLPSPHPCRPSRKLSFTVRYIFYLPCSSITKQAHICMSYWDLFFLNLTCNPSGNFISNNTSRIWPLTLSTMNTQV